MKDLAGIEIEEGDLILDIRTDWPVCQVGIATGGATPTHKVRFVTWDGWKKNSHEKCILKISPEKAEEVLFALKEKLEGRNAWQEYRESKLTSFIEMLNENYK